MSGSGTLHLLEVRLFPEKGPDLSVYPFNLPLFHHTQRIAFTTGVTFFVGENVECGPDAVIGPHAVVGEGCRLGAGCRVRDCVLLPGAVVEAGEEVAGAVRSRAFEWRRVKEA